MKKLKLDPDQIRVASFSMQDETGREGTVYANSCSTVLYTKVEERCGPTQKWDSCYSCSPLENCQPMPISWELNMC